MDTRTQDERRTAAAPVRQCAVTRDRLETDALIRFCLSPDGEAVPDLKQKLPGRGVWVTARRDIVEQATRSGLFSRAFRQQTRAAPELADEIDALLERAALERLSLANKAGLVVSGQAKVEQALGKGAVRILLHGRDGAPGGKEKIDRLARDAGPVIIGAFTVEQLGLALGRSNVVHAAVNNGGACDSFMHAVYRLQHYRGDVAAPAAA